MMRVFLTHHFKNRGNFMIKDKKALEGLDEHELNGLGRCLLKAAQAYYETESGQLAFKEFEASGLDLNKYFETEDGQLVFIEFKENMENSDK